MKVVNLVQLALIVAFVLCLFPMPYGYFMLVRFMAMTVFAMLAIQQFKQQNSEIAILWLALAILFQPFYKINLGREIWNLVDIVLAIILAIKLWKEKKTID